MLEYTRTLPWNIQGPTPGIYKVPPRHQMNAHCQSVIARSSKFSLKSGPHTIIMKTYQRWLSCLFSVIVAITGGGGTRGVSSTEASCDSVAV